MSMLSGALSEDWEVKVEGTYGEFITPAGEVSYLLTKAKLGIDATKESSLTKYLAPVREVLSVEKMDFNQLLQRDLDDYRVATGLLDYVLSPQVGGPAFYTPILAALLPFEGVKPVDYYPRREGGKGFKDTDNIAWRQEKYGNAFRVLKFATDESGESLQPIKLGRLEFNTALNKLVVIDGQHRAMALLAIRRTIANEWDNSRGARYKSFYEKRVRELLPGQNSKILDSIEFPVCICWFPEMTSDSNPLRSPHTASRKLFVDVNKNARTPSKSRLILLSDSELIPILVRAFLNRVRAQDSSIPLHVIEYDYPKSKGESYPVRPLALLNIVILENSLDMALRGGKYIKDTSLKVRGRPNQKDSDAYLRKELEVKDWLPQEIEEEGLEGIFNFETSNLGNENLPHSKIQDIEEVFMGSWGEVFLKLLSDFYPFKCHIEAVKSLESTWTAAATSQAELAKDAMFRGLGIYWTLKEEFTKWEEENKRRKDFNQPPEAITETCKAWMIVLQKEDEFSMERAKKYFSRKSISESSSKDKGLIRSSQNIFSTLRTQAFITGSILALASLKNALDYSLEKFNKRSEFWIESWNAYLLKSRKNLHLFDRSRDDSFLKFSKLDSPYSIYFRYLIFEIMHSAGEDILNEQEILEVKNLLSKTRRIYLEELTNQQLKALRKTSPELSKQEALNRAQSEAEELLSTLCKNWFSVSKSDFQEWKEYADQNFQEDSANLTEDEEIEDGQSSDGEDDSILDEFLDFED